MRINLVQEDTEKEVEVVFSKSGDSVYWTEDDGAVIYINDFNESQVCIGLGDIDMLIEALNKIREFSDGQ